MDEEKHMKAVEEFERKIAEATKRIIGSEMQEIGQLDKVCRILTVIGKEIAVTNALLKEQLERK